MCTSAVLYPLALGPESDAECVKFTSADTALQSGTNPALRDLCR